MRSGTSLAVQRLRLHASTVGGTSSVAGKGTKILSSAQQGQKKIEIFLSFPVDLNLLIATLFFSISDHLGGHLIPSPFTVPLSLPDPGFQWLCLRLEQFSSIILQVHQIHYLQTF